MAALAALIAVLLSCGGGRVLFAQDVELLGVDVARQARADETLPVTLRLRAQHPLDVDDWIFIHVQPERGDKNPCNAALDVPPAVETTRWTEGLVVVEGRVHLDRKCQPGRVEIYVGLYNRQSSARLAVIEPHTRDNRIFAGSTDIVVSDPDTTIRVFTPNDLSRGELWLLMGPWVPWLVAIFLSGAFALGVRLDDLPSAAGTSPNWMRRVALALPAVPFFLGILVVLEFVKDDAYISFRYAHNLVTGRGLVFNTGERLEGFTNFLWVFLLAPFEALGWDLFQVCEVLGTTLGITCLVVTARLTAWVQGEREDFSHLWGALWLSTSSSFVLWAKSGLEQPLGSLLPIAGAFILWRAREQLARGSTPAERKSLEARHLIAGLLMGAASITRPELHLLAILVGMPLVLDAISARTIGRTQWLYVGGILAVTVPCHAFRYLYYGTLIPNTFYAKTGTGSTVWRDGLNTLHDMFEFNHTGALAVLAPIAFANRRRLLEKVVMTTIALSFMAYIVAVGVDEMQWHRLYLPALPFLCVLAALGAQNLMAGAQRLFRGRAAAHSQWVTRGLAWGAVLFAAWNSFQFTYREQHGFDGHGDLAGTFHPDMGKFLVRHERPGGLVAFQDMGSTPYHAPDINFLDFIGLVDKTVAHARRDYGLHAFLGGNPADVQAKYDARMRGYFFERNPEWVILTIYPPSGTEESLRRLFDQDPTGASLGDAYRNNPYQFALWDDSLFQQRYVAVRTWPRSNAYYLALWRRRDLWERTPGEVVLDAVPADLGGAKAKLEGGLELLGSEVTARTLERHEAFVTTWWRLPGPLPPDLYFFVHVTKTGTQIPGDHVPGDWMYPADRWKPGEILEDRTLFQLPPFTMQPGTYSVYVGAYWRTRGQRLKVVGGAIGAQDRIFLGTIDVRPLHPLVNQLIVPTRVDIMRKYPDRIVDSHR